MSSSRKSAQEMPFDSLANRFRDSVNCEENKPDFKELDLGSPVSPLITRATVTPSSSSSSSGSVSGKTNSTQLVQRSNGASKSHSGELIGCSETSPSISESFRSAPTTPYSKPDHRRSVSAGVPLIYCGKSFAKNGNGGSNGATSVTSQPSKNVLPSGNICPSSKILKSGMGCKASNRSDVLRSWAGNYGHGSIMRGSAKSGSHGNLADCNVSGIIQCLGESGTVKRAMVSSDPDEVKKNGNEMFRRGNFAEALSLYDRAIALSPGNSSYHSNRAAALTSLGRLGEAVSECEEAVKLDPCYVRAHQRLASLFLRLGQVENARRHESFSGQQSDPAELQKLQLLEKHLNRCVDSRKAGVWKNTLRELDAAIAIGADSSPQLVACKAEAFLKLHQLEDADTSLLNIPKIDHCPPSYLQTKFFGMLAEAYVHYVRAHVEMALGRFENAVVLAEKAALIDYGSIEISLLLNNVKMVARSRTSGNDLFSSGRFSEACKAYGEGLKYDSSNSVLYCNRAVCWAKLGLWEKSVEDCNQAIRIQPNYTKALLRRAVSNGKLGRWTEAVRDYEVLRRELPGDNEVVESLLNAQRALKKYCGEEFHTTKFGDEVEEVSTLDKYKAAISSPGVSVFHFKVASNEQCEEISPFVNMLCVRYPSICFFKVDVEECFGIAKAENIRSTPTFKIYKNGDRVKEMIRPSHQVLEDCVRSYSL